MQNPNDTHLVHQTFLLLYDKVLKSLLDYSQLQFRPHELMMADQFRLPHLSTLQRDQLLFEVVRARPLFEMVTQ